MVETLDPQRTAVVFFDTLKVYAYDRKLGSVVPEARAQVDALAALMRLARAQGMPIFYAHADHRADGKDGASALTDLDLARTNRPADAADPFAHPVWGTAAAAIIDEIAPQPGDYLIPKHRWDMFFQTELELSLRARDIDTILLAGGSTEVGVASSAYSGRDLDFNLILVRETMRSGRGRWVSDFFVDEIAPSLARIRSLGQVASMLGAVAPALLAEPVGSTTPPPTLAPIAPGADSPLDPLHTAVVFFDLLKGGHYDDAGQLRPEAQAHIGAAQRLLATARRLGLPIVFTQPIHRPDGADWCSALTDRVGRPNVERFGRLRINPGSAAGSREADFLTELAPEPGDYIIRKHRYSAFHGTPLELSLLRAGVTNLVLCGVAINAGVASTAYAARDRDFNLVVCRDACRASSPEVTAYFMDHVFPRLGRVRTVDQTVNLLGE